MIKIITYVLPWLKKTCRHDIEYPFCLTVTTDRQDYPDILNVEDCCVWITDKVCLPLDGFVNHKGESLPEIFREIYAEELAELIQKNGEVEQARDIE